MNRCSCFFDVFFCLFVKSSFSVSNASTSNNSVCHNFQSGLRKPYQIDDRYGRFPCSD